MKKLITDWRLYWFLLLLPVALFLPAIPIDETRYLAIGWEMRMRGDYWMPYLDGNVYTGKGPVFFWLMNLDWLVAGNHVWAVRLSVVGTSFASLVLFERVALRLSGDATLARRASLLLAGMMLFAVFAALIMFDVLLTTCVLIVLHGVLDLDDRRDRRGVALITLGIALGLLVKGPVVLLDAGLVALLAPWWSASARSAPLRWYGLVLLGVLGGAAAALAWALVASGGWDYLRTVLLHQTVERLSSSFAHERPWWWYLMVLPVMVLPWTLSLRAPWRAWRDSVTGHKLTRFGSVWFAAPLIVFSFVSGKQPHYLLPLLPGVALYFAHVLNDRSAVLRGRGFGLLLFLCGLALVSAPHLFAHASELPLLVKHVENGDLDAPTLKLLAGIWPIWGILLALIGAYLFAHPRAHTSITTLTLASVASATLSMLTIAQSLRPTVDVSAAAVRIRAAQESGKPIVHLGWHHALFEFADRLRQPLEAIDTRHL